MHLVLLTILSLGILNVQAGEYGDRFLELYKDIVDPKNEYFSKEGVPYHTRETLIVESTDYGHETDSEAFSYNVYLKALYGYYTGDFEPFNQAWDMIEQFMIPTLQTNSENYDPKNPKSSPDITVGQDPIFEELKTAYNTSQVYIMHWLSDVDNIYGFGNVQGECELGPEADGPSFVNLGQGALWEGFNTPTCDSFKYGGVNGFQFTFGNATKRYGYGAGTDADARAVQAAYWAAQWAREKGQLSNITATLDKAAKMGDFLRYTFYDGYFKQIGNCIGKDCPISTDKNGSHYLISWGISWGGNLEANSSSWRNGNPVAYYGYQNLVAAYGLVTEPTIKPRGVTAVEDWTVALDRQMELYEYLQTNQGAFAAGVTNSWEKTYGDPPEEYKNSSFHGMWFDYQPGYADANPWFGFQPWTADRVAQYYYITGDKRAEKIISKWVKWAINQTIFEENGDYSMPFNIKWEGLPPNTVVTAVNYAKMPGPASSTARTLSYYAARSGDEEAKTVAKKLLDALWTHHRTPVGIAANQTWVDYKNFNHKLLIPLANWTGVYPNGDIINENSTFLSVRSWFKKDPNWHLVQEYLDGGDPPQIAPHRFWEQADMALALGAYDMLFS